MGDKLNIDPESGLIIEEVITVKSGKDSKIIPTVSSIDREQRTDTKETLKEETDALNIERELKRGYREIDIPPYGKLHINKPSIDDDYEADLAYAKEVSRLMDSEDLPTREEMEVKLEKRGTWTAKDTADLDELRKEMVETTTEIIMVKSEYKSTKSVSVKSKLTELNDRYNKARTEFFKKEAIRSRFMSLTLEGRADEQRLVVKMSRCITRPDGKRVWETPDLLKKEKDSEPVGRLVFEFVTFSQGVDPRVLSQIPDFLDEVGNIAI